MTELEAMILYDDIRDEIKSRKQLVPQLRKLGNGDHVVVVDEVYMWSYSDWNKLKHQWKKWLKASAFSDIIVQTA